MEKVDVICIDGPTASGKGTIASKIAEKLGFHYLDSGALYRLTALQCVKSAVDLDDIEACAAVARNLQPRFVGGEIYLGDEIVTEAIRAEKIGLTASKIAAYVPVRSELLDLQRRTAKAPGLVADGRDMGSTVFPDAPLKVFLTASSEARAKRRYLQLIGKGVDADLQRIIADLEERDRRDRERATAPCVPCEGARVLDSSNIGIEEVCRLILDWWQECRRA